MLEYTGRGKSIIDVGLAQARFPLDTTNHYFEIEIVDPGENCYIAIGLAKRVSIYESNDDKVIRKCGPLSRSGFCWRMRS